MFVKGCLNSHLCVGSEDLGWVAVMGDVVPLTSHLIAAKEICFSVSQEIFNQLGSSVGSGFKALGAQGASHDACDTVSFLLKGVTEWGC